MNLFAAGAFAAFALSSAVVAAPDVPSGDYVVDPTHASVTWKVNHLGLSNYTARFTNLDATVSYNAETPAASSVSATINPASVETDYPFPDQTDFDAEIRGEQFFNVAAFSEITFQSTGLELTGENSGVLKGDLTFHGVTKAVELDLTLVGAMAEHPYAKRPAFGFSATGIVKRSDFGVDYLVPYIGDDVTVIIEAEFIKAE